MLLAKRARPDYRACMEWNGTDKIRLIAKTLPGLEDVLAAELVGLGADEVRPMRRSVEFSGNRETVYRANLWLRIATRVLQPILQFNVHDDKQLYRHISRIDWPTVFDVDSTFAVDVVALNSRFNHSLFVAQKAKDAIVDSFRKKHGRRPSVDKDHPDIRVNLYIDGTAAVLSLDTSSASLGRRGYRRKGGGAPISEVLAAGIIALAGWDRRSPLIDTMCGSGTFLIEAAMMARNIAPGLKRERFGFQKVSGYDRSLWEKLRSEARGLIGPSLKDQIYGSDIDPAIVRVARKNSELAGVQDDLKLDCKSFSEYDPPDRPGILIMNPPYDHRIQLEDQVTFHGMIGDTLKEKYAGWRALILAGNPSLVKQLGLRTSSRRELHNGPIQCRLLEYELYGGSRKKGTEPDS